VIDASVAINLNGTGNPQAILEALPNPVIVTDVVLDELREDARTKRDDGTKMEALIDRGIVTVAEIANLPGVVFETLVVGSGPDTLDDGEAATVAYAVETGCVAVLDERKGHRISAREFPKTPLANTIDILAHPAVEKALGRPVLADYVFNALQFSRMRVFPHHIEWVVDLIGVHRARMCPSLPRHVRQLDEGETVAE
jgi:predicted nucleic acid-binding protein